MHEYFALINVTGNKQFSQDMRVAFCSLGSPMVPTFLRHPWRWVTLHPPSIKLQHPRLRALRRSCHPSTIPPKYILAFSSVSLWQRVAEFCTSFSQSCDRFSTDYFRFRWTTGCYSSFDIKFISSAISFRIMKRTKQAGLFIWELI